jgi:GNAT superfamily N-acetyltransferase
MTFATRMNSHDCHLRRVDPQGADALSLLREAAIEARALYPALHDEGASWPGNAPTPPGGTYLIAYDGDTPIACGALRPIDRTSVEVRRMFVLKHARRCGLARSMLAALEREASRLGYSVMRLETGHRQTAAVALYESCGFERIALFGEHVGDPTSVCFEKQVA